MRQGEYILGMLHQQDSGKHQEHCSTQNTLKVEPVKETLPTGNVVTNRKDAQGSPEEEE